jgi:ribosomal protein S27AE
VVLDKDHNSCPKCVYVVLDKDHNSCPKCVYTINEG